MNSATYHYSCTNADRPGVRTAGKQRQRRIGLDLSVGMAGVVAVASLMGRVPIDAYAIPCRPPSTAEPIVIVASGFNEVSGSPTDDLGYALADQVGGEVFGPYRQAQNPGVALGEAIAEVLEFNGRPLELVKKPLKVAIKLGKAAVKAAGLPFVSRREFRRAKKELNAALNENPDRPIYILGYSYGSVTARLLARRLERKGRRVERVILLDPVHVLHPQVAGSVKKILDPFNKRLLMSQSLSERTVVFYQTGDSFIEGMPVGPTDGVANHDITGLLEDKWGCNGVLSTECCNVVDVACLHTKLNADADVALDVLVAAEACCGNGQVEGLEQCDDGNAQDGDCCSSTCQLEPSSVVCRPATGSCDVAESCDGAADSCPSDGFRPSGFACAADADACTDDTCDGAGNCSVGPLIDCDDGDVCTGTETCDPVAGCQSLSPLTCDDSDICTDDSCDPISGCQFTPDTSNDPSCCGNGTFVWKATGFGIYCGCSSGPELRGEDTFEAATAYWNAPHPHHACASCSVISLIVDGVQHAHLWDLEIGSVTLEIIGCGNGDVP